MTYTHTLRRKTPARRQSHLAVIELPDEIAAFQAYRLLQYHGISPENLAIVGKGYSSPEHIGLLRPVQIARRKSLSISIISGSLGTVIGCLVFVAGATQAFSTLTINAIQNADPADWLIVPAFGLSSGFLGAVFGALWGFFGEGTAAELYRHRLRQGRYLLMIEGSEKLVRWSQKVLRHYATSRLY